MEQQHSILHEKLYHLIQVLGVAALYYPSYVYATSSDANVTSSIM